MRNYQKTNMSTTLQEKVDAAKVIVKLFNMERIAVFIAATLSILILLLLAIYSFVTGQMDWNVFVGLFIPTGGISFSCALILRMFTKCLKFLQEEVK